MRRNATDLIRDSITTQTVPINMQPCGNVGDVRLSGEHKNLHSRAQLTGKFLNTNL